MIFYWIFLKGLNTYIYCGAGYISMQNPVYRKFWAFKLSH